MFLICQPHSALLVRTEQKTEAHTRKAGRRQSSPACEKMIASKRLSSGFPRGSVEAKFRVICPSSMCVFSLLAPKLGGRLQQSGLKNMLGSKGLTRTPATEMST